MAFEPPRNVKPPKIRTKTTNDWENGVVSAFDDGRTPIGGLRSTQNTILEQDGVIRPRFSLNLFGPQPTGEVLGELYQFRTLSGLSPTNRLISMQKITRNEIQSLVTSGTPTGGTFTITYSGQTTSAIAYNASAATIQTALEALSNIEAGDVACTGGPLPAIVYIEFKGNLAQTDVDALTTTDSLTGGTSPETTIAEVKKGATSVGRIFTATPEDTAWTEITTPTTDDYHATARAHFSQLDNKVIITNGEDELSYYDTADAEIIKFEALTDPSAPTHTNNGLTGTSYNVFYAVTANSSVGETSGAQLKVPVSKPRELWKEDGSENIVISWTTVTGVKSWNVYCAVTADGDDVPKWGLLATGIGADTLTFTDTGFSGSGAPNFFKEMPKINSTAGPKATRSEIINGRVWMTGDKSNPYYLWYGGDYGYELDFTPANGGGFVNVGSGTRELPVKVWNFRTGPGEPIIKCLTSGVNGTGKRYSISSSTFTYGNNTFVDWAAQEDYGFSGTDSPDALIVYGNNTYYPSRDNFKTIGTKPQLQNLLSIDGIADSIIDDLDFLNQDAMNKAVGVGFENRLYFALPVGSSSNNQIWVLDLQRKGAWMKPWGVNADWLALIADNNGKTHLVVVEGSNIYEFNRASKTADNGTGFVTSGNSGHQLVDESGQEWARLIKVIITVLRPKGEINFAVNGFTSKGKLERLGTASLDERSTSTNAGWGESAWGTFGWSRPYAVPNITSVASKEVVIKVNKDIQYWTFSWNSTGANVDYAIARVVPVYVPIGIKNIS
jgi:hypothetical protein